MPDAPTWFPPTLAELERLADAAIARLPDQFKSWLDGVVLRVVEEADDETLDALDLDSPYELTGLYSGRSLAEQSQWVSGELPPAITLYRRAILLEWLETEVELGALVTHVIVHEVGHHFGLSDADMHALEDEAQADAG